MNSSPWIRLLNATVFVILYFVFQVFPNYASLLRNTLGAKKSISTGELMFFIELRELNKCM